MPQSAEVTYVWWRGTLGPKQDATIEFSLNEIEHDTPQNKTTSQTPDTALLKLLQ
jgi:hypothetical protein